MTDFLNYSSTLWALWVVITTVLVQGVIAAAIKAKQPNAIPGVMPEHLDHHSVVFRTSRTHANSLENLAVFLGSAVVAILAGADAFWLSVWTWGYALGRLVHMALYYAIATNKNPSPRTYFYLLALLCNIAVLLQIAWTLIN